MWGVTRKKMLKDRKAFDISSLALFRNRRSRAPLGIVVQPYQTRLRESTLRRDSI